MSFRWSPREHIYLGRYILKWFCLTAPMAAVVGSACALFLWSLERATQIRFDFPWLLFLLPLAGVVISLLYSQWGRSAEGGNNLLMDAIHSRKGGDSSVIVPRRMAPLILITTVITHLFGGSAGREGTAMQMGGSIAAAAGRWMKLKNGDMRILLMAGIAAGFGGVFGTPLTGAVFALEVLALGRMNYDALIPCLIASVISNWACRAWGIDHAHYFISSAASQLGGVAINWLLAAKVALAAMAFGLVSVLFAELTHGIGHLFKQLIRYPYLRPVAGALCLIALTYIMGTRDYLGLGMSSPDPHGVTVLSCFLPNGADDWSWWWKVLFTSITLGSGFKGGEVTPLFFIGAALGNTLGRFLGAPVDLFAGLGLVAVFAGATNTPLACTIMGIELFGSQYTIYLTIACFLAYLFSGHSGIYLSQRIGTPKIDSMEIPPDASLRVMRELRPGWTVFTGWRERTNIADIAENGDVKMAHRHMIKSREIGQVRIYMTPGERRKKSGKGVKALLQSGVPLYVEIIKDAKREGLMNATAHHTRYGFSGNGNVQSDITEIANPRLSLFVELIGSRSQLEDFCRKHGDLLRDKVVVYKHMEHWDIDAHSLHRDEIDLTEYQENTMA